MYMMMELKGCPGDEKNVAELSNWKGGLAITPGMHSGEGREATILYRTCLLGDTSGCQVERATG
jgi:hypothetical protein